MIRIFSVLKFLVILVVCTVNLPAQPPAWQVASNIHDNTFHRELIYSENLDLIVNVGLFNPHGDRYIAGFNGEEWVTIEDDINSTIRAFTDYEEGFLVGGGTITIEGQVIPHIAYFNGTEWELPWIFNDNVSQLIWANDTLFALGTFTEIDGEPIYNIAKLVDGHWEPMLWEIEDIGFSLFRDIEYYQGYYYVSGNFETGSGPDDLARLENGALHVVGTGVVGSLAAVGDLHVYQGELYASGAIPLFQGNVGNHIIRWDGSTLRDVGGPFLDSFGELSGVGGVSKMIEHDGYLYCAGSFFYIGDKVIQRVARWDGSQWCGMRAEGFENIIFSIAIIDDKMLLLNLSEYNESTDDTHSFWLNSDLSLISECTEPLSAEQVSDPTSMKIYPNPSSGLFQISSQENMEGIRVWDAIGRQVQNQILNTPQTEIDLSAQPPGLYFVQVKTEKGSVVKKLVLE